MVGAEHPAKVVPQLQVGRGAGRERAGGRPATAVLVQGADDVGAATKVGRQGPVEHLNEEYNEYYNGRSISIYTREFTK